VGELAVKIAGVVPLSGMDADIRREVLKLFKKQGVGFGFRHGVQLP